MTAAAAVAAAVAVRLDPLGRVRRRPARSRLPVRPPGSRRRSVCFASCGSRSRSGRRRHGRGPGVLAGAAAGASSWRRRRARVVWTSARTPPRPSWPRAIRRRAISWNTSPFGTGTIMATSLRRAFIQTLEHLLHPFELVRTRRRRCPTRTCRRRHPATRERGEEVSTIWMAPS